MSLLTHWKEWFESWGDHKIGHTISIEEMYQAFKARYMQEPPEQPPAHSEAPAASSGEPFAQLAQTVAPYFESGATKETPHA